MSKKKVNISYILFIILLFVFMIRPVYALDTYILTSDCGGIFDDEVIKFLQDAFNVFKFLAPILTLVLTTMDFIKAAASQDKEALQKSAKTAIKRVILAMCLYFIPVLINVLFDLLGWYGTCGIG